MHEFQVIVLGAGAAALAAVAELSQHGTDIIVLEARDRIGGRIFTQRLPGTALPIELGADFIHGEPKETFDIVKAAGIDVYEFNGEDWYFRRGRLTRSGDFWQEVAAINKKLSKYKGKDVSFADFLKRECPRADPKACQMASGFVEGFHAAHTDRISIQSLIASEEASDVMNGEKQFRIRSGYDRVVQHLERDLVGRNVPIRLNTVVRSVEWKRGSVTVHAERNGRPQRFRARKALVTLPLGVLKATSRQRGAVRFSPELKEKATALKLLQMGSVMKLVLNFRSAFWREAKARSGTLDSLGFLHATNEPFPTWWTTAPVDSTLLTGWTGGPSAEKLSVLSQREILKTGLNTLSKIFNRTPVDLRSLLESHHVHPWRTDPFSRGAYSYIGVGGMNAPENLAEPISDTLYFAGEATSAGGHFGTVHGALQSGYRAGREILPP